MKKVLPPFAFILLCFSAWSQVPSSCNPPAALTAAYSDDVKDLALMRIRAQGAPDTADIAISAIYQDTIWSGLAAIYNATSIPARDSVFDIHCVHNVSPMNTAVYRSIYVSVDTSFAWTQPWRNLTTTTGNAPLDNLLAQYGFTVTGYMNFIHVATLTTTQALNVFPLTDSLETFGGVNYAEPNPLAGDANRINYSMSGNDQYYDFTLGWGDCPSGCTEGYTWKFKVDYSTCAVQYLGAVPWGQWISPFPSPVNCGISSGTGDIGAEEAALQIFPNPSQGVFTVATDQSLRIEIADVTGRIIKLYLQPQQNQLVNLEGFPGGVYLVKTITAGGSATAKVLVE